MWKSIVFGLSLRKNDSKVVMAIHQHVWALHPAWILAWRIYKRVSITHMSLSSGKVFMWTWNPFLKIDTQKAPCERASTYFCGSRDAILSPHILSNTLGHTHARAFIEEAKSEKKIDLSRGRKFLISFLSVCFDCFSFCLFNKLLSDQWICSNCPSDVHRSWLVF